MEKKLLCYIALGFCLGYTGTDVLAQGRSTDPRQAPTETSSPSERQVREGETATPLATKTGTERNEMHLVKVAASESQLSTLNSMLDHADLKGILEQGGPYTIFAPIDQAFEKLSSKQVETLLKAENKDKLRAWVAGHIVEGEYQVKDLQDGQRLHTITNQELLVQRNADKVTIDGIEILDADVKASNGVIHVINAVMLTREQKEQEAKRRRDDANMLKSGKRGMSKP